MKVKPALYRLAHTSTIIAFLCILSTTTVVMAANVTLLWDPNHPTPDGYRVFARKGQQAYNYSQPDWEGAAAICTLDNLEGQTEYYFVIRAYDGSLESSDSSEAHYIPPIMDNDGDGTYSWRVRFFDSGGRASAWSARANFTTQAADDDLDGNGVGDDQEGGVGQAHVTRALSSPTITCEPTDLVVASETIVSEIEQMVDRCGEAAATQVGAGAIACGAFVRQPPKLILLPQHNVIALSMTTI